MSEFHDILDIVVAETGKKHDTGLYATEAFRKLMQHYNSDRFDILLSRIHHKYLPNVYFPPFLDSRLIHNVVKY